LRQLSADLASARRPGRPPRQMSKVSKRPGGALRSRCASGNHACGEFPFRCEVLNQVRRASWTLDPFGRALCDSAHEIHTACWFNCRFWCANHAVPSSGSGSAKVWA
jgi:hypothetical protein